MVKTSYQYDSQFWRSSYKKNFKMATDGNYIGFFISLNFMKYNGEDFMAI